MPGVDIVQVQQSVLPEGAASEASLTDLKAIALLLQQLVIEMRASAAAMLPDAAGRTRIVAEGGTIAAVTTVSTVTTATTVTNLTNAYDAQTGSLRTLMTALHDDAFANLIRSKITVT